MIQDKLNIIGIFFIGFLLGMINESKFKFVSINKLQELLHEEDQRIWEAANKETYTDLEERDEDGYVREVIGIDKLKKIIFEEKK